jgi:hypothetical protein
VYDVYDVFGIGMSDIVDLLSLNTSDLMEDMESYLINRDFEDTYFDFIIHDKSIIFKFDNDDVQLRWSWRELFNDPCGFGATATLVAYSAARLIIGGASVAGAVVAVASVAIDIYGYAKDCS